MKKLSIEQRSWLNVVALALAAFIFNTTEFIPIALLSDIGRSFNMLPTAAGIMITIYAWVVALLSLPLMLATKNVERRRLLIVLFGLFVVCHVLSFFAWNFPVLLASRVGIALSHAVFWSITAALAMRIAPKGKGNQALGLLSTGTVMAMVLGIPLGRLIGNAYGWRVSFLLIGIAALMAAVVLAKGLPKLPSVNSGSLASLPLLFRRKTLLMLFGYTVLIITAHFTAYSYIEPFILETAGLPARDVTLILLVYGVAGFLGSYLFGRFYSRYTKRFFVVAASLVTGSMLLLLPASLSVYLLAVLSLVWGVGIMAVGLSMQSRVLYLASDATDVASSIHSGLYNVGIGGGALLGHYASNYVGLSGIGFIGGAIGLLALALARLLIKRPDFEKAGA